jgi:hypothetical protein
MAPAVSTSVHCLESPILLLPDGAEVATLRHMNPVSTATCLTALVVSTLVSGCGAPAIEGVFNDRPFSIANEQPERRGGGATLVFAEADDVTGVLRTVSVTLPSALEVGALSFGAGGGGAGIEVIEGDLVRIPLNNGTGKTLLTSGDDTRVAHGVGGEVVIDDVSAGVHGSFAADLDDGGHLDGWFHVAP